MSLKEQGNNIRAFIEIFFTHRFKMTNTTFASSINGEYKIECYVKPIAS